MLRHLPLLIIVIVIDFFFLPVVEYWIENMEPLWQCITKTIHFAIPFALIVLLWGNDRFRWRKRNRFGFIKVYAFFQLTYICKMIGLVVLGVLGLFDLGIDLFQYFHVDLSNIGSSRYIVATIASSIPFVLLPYGILFNRHRYQVREVVVQIKDLPEALHGLSIVQISDIHSGSFFDPKGFKKGVEMINDIHPDLIFFTGDLVNNRAVEFLPFVDTFGSLHSKYGIYSVLGNHDYGDYVRWKSADAKTRNLQQLVDIQTSMGWKLLLNEHQVIEVDQGKVAVIGVENYSAKLRFPKYGDLTKATGNMKQVDLQLLLSHDPSHWNSQITKNFPKIDITFSGHTHGMQFGIELGNWKWSPIKYIYKEWAGLYSSDRQYLYVNRGFGVLGYPGRVGILPEITHMTISKA